MKSVMFLATALLVLVLHESSSAAYKLEPISRVFDPAGSGATRSFEVINNGRARIALTVSFATLERDQDYAESNHDADDEFLVYPPQFVLAAGAHQTVRVTWLGTPTPARELAYRIIVQQVPIALLDRTYAPDVSTGKMRINLTYRGTVFIRPPHATPSVTVDSATAVTRDGTTALALVLHNSGTAVGMVRSCTVRMATAGSAIEVPASITTAVADTRILAGGTRRYFVAWPAGPSLGPLKASGRCATAP